VWRGSVGVELLLDSLVEGDATHALIAMRSVLLTHRRVSRLHGSVRREWVAGFPGRNDLAGQALEDVLVSDLQTFHHRLGYEDRLSALLDVEEAGDDIVDDGMFAEAVCQLVVVPLTAPLDVLYRQSQCAHRHVRFPSGN
jgi:hypothetical protein